MATPETAGAYGVAREFANMDILCRSVIANGQTLVPEAEFLAGKTYYVDSAVDGAGGTSPGTAVGTLDEAFALCTANKGDRIVVMPNHAETVTGAAGIAADVAGVTVIGLGRGNQRPRFLMDGATTVTASITGADTTFHNLVFAAGHADIVTGIVVGAAGVTLSSLEFVENVATENFLSEIKVVSTTDNLADDLKIINCRAITIDASALEFVEINGDLSGLVFQGNFISKDGATGGVGILCATGKDLTSCLITDNYLMSGATSGATLVNSDTSANTGIVARNWIGHHDTDAAAPIDVTGARIFENYAVGVDDASALLLPAVDDNA